MSILNKSYPHPFSRLDLFHLSGMTVRYCHLAGETKSPDEASS